MNIPEAANGLLRLLLVCGVACLTIVAQAAPPIPVEIPADVGQVPVWQALRIVSPAENKIEPEQAAELAAGIEAMAVHGPEDVLGRAILPYWGLFSLHNPEASEQFRLLAIETTTQFDIRLFVRGDQGAWRPVRSLADAAGGRIGSGTTHPIWELSLAPGQNVQLLLRVEGPAIVRFPVFVYHPASYAEQQRKIHIAIGLALGSCLMIGIYIGSLRRYFDDRSVPLFSYMLIANLLGAVWLSGFLSELFPALPESTLSPIGFAAFAVLYGCGSLHARVYLDTAAWAPLADRILQALGWFWLGLAPWFAVAFPALARVLAVWGGAAIALILVAASILAARRKVPFSGFIAAAWVAYLLFGMTFLIARHVDNPVLWPSSTHALTQATVIAILFGLAMSQRLMRHRDMLVEAHQEAEMQRERMTVITRERTLLFAATNHDLRQPLLGVRVFADLLKSARAPEERETYSMKLDMALKEVDDLLVRIQQLAAVHEAPHQLPMETVIIDDLLAPLVEEYRGRAEYKQITVRYVPSRLTITTHIPYFQRIVRNVLSNAIRYTDRGDRVLVGCRRGGGPCLVIADTGRGMSEEQTQRAFKVFQRFDSSVFISDGFGLGLFSTKIMAQSLGLEIGLQSQAGYGTQFKIFISPSTN